MLKIMLMLYTVYIFIPFRNDNCLTLYMGGVIQDVPSFEFIYINMYKSNNTQIENKFIQISKNIQNIYTTVYHFIEYYLHLMFHSVIVKPK